LTWTFTLRKGLVFSDGSPVTAVDAVTSIERWGKKDNLGRAMFAAGAQLKADSVETFTLTLKEPFGLVLDALSKPSGNPLFIYPQRLAKTDVNTPVTEMVGSGPFLFVKEEWVPGNKVVYVKNPKYVPRSEPADGLAGGKVVKVDRVEWVYIPDGNTAVAALKNGEIDMIESVTPDFLPSLAADKNVQLNMSSPAQGMMVINTLHPPFNNAKARQALYHMVDQETYTAALGYPDKYRVKYCGSLYTCNTPVELTTGSERYRKADLNKAKQLLKESGYKGEKVVVLYATDQVLAPASQVTISLLKKIGVNVDVQTMDWASVAARRLKKDAPEKGGWHIFHTYGTYFDAATPITNPWLAASCGNSLPGWPCDEELDKLRNAWIKEGDVAKRKDLAGKMQVRAYETVPYVMWGQYYPVHATRGLKNHEPMKVGIPVMWNVEK
jgi:peptide/nickel transport system substrate-binding protein